MNSDMDRVNKEDGMTVCELIDEDECWSTNDLYPWPDSGNEDVIKWGVWVPGDRSSPNLKTLPESLERLERWVEWIPMGWQRVYLDMRCALASLGVSQHRDVQIHEPSVVDGGLVFDVEGSDRAVCGILRKAWARSRCTCMNCGRTGKPRRMDGYVKTLCARCCALEVLSRGLDQALHEPWNGDPLQVSPAWPKDLSPLVRVLMKEGARLGALEVDSLEDGEVIPPAVQAWLRDVWEHVQRQLDAVASRTIP
jgi:hypothetical protein